VFLALYLWEPTSDATLVFYGASMLLAALRGYGGCEVLAASNWLLGRDDQVAVRCSGPSTAWSIGEPGRLVMTTTRQEGRRPLIEVLYVHDCPHYQGALGLVERVRTELGIDAELRTSLIGDQAAAERARFPGSPTIRVDDRDVEPGNPASRTSSLACRLYRHEHGLAGQPAERWIRDALLAAAGRTDATSAPQPRSTTD
jgi:hypothetical protein